MRNQFFDGKPVEEVQGFYKGNILYFSFTRYSNTYIIIFFVKSEFTKNDSHNSNDLEIWNWFFEEFGLTWLDIGVATCKEMIDKFPLGFILHYCAQLSSPHL